MNPIRAILTREFKLNKHLRYSDELYDLKNNPLELRNLANVQQYAKVKEQLAQKLNECIRNNENTFYSLKATSISGETID